MTHGPRPSWALPAVTLVDPWTAFRRATEGAAPFRWAGTILAAAAALGVATLPRQVAILDRTLVVLGDAAFDAQRELLRAGVLRLLMVDRVVPAPTLLVAAVLLLVTAEPVLMVARERRAGLIAVIVLGLVPLVVQRLGELAVTYLLDPVAAVTAGDAIMLPHRFTTGPALLWLRSEVVPGWVEVLETRLNLISVWCVGLWSVGLRVLDDRSWASWHLTLPLACLVGAGVLTWAVGPIVIQIVLR